MQGYCVLFIARPKGWSRAECEEESEPNQWTPDGRHRSKAPPSVERCASNPMLVRAKHSPHPRCESESTTPDGILPPIPGTTPMNHAPLPLVPRQSYTARRPLHRCYDSAGSASGSKSGWVRSTTTVVMSSLRFGICESQRRAHVSTMLWHVAAGGPAFAIWLASSFSITSHTPSEARTRVWSLSSRYRVEMSGVGIRYGCTCMSPSERDIATP
mmetsp:Transcript_9010/g.18322  ORF Transcript_9010/g.18322 Transcript_9010/m.18322 type:complete len:214 (-) Transcript_9010:252-893(-)